jgi:hypothetical protein
MRAINLDLSVLGVEDLEALRLGAQVLRHRAELEGRPRVAAFFAALGRGADDAIHRRSRSNGAWDGSLTVVLQEPVDGLAESAHDDRLLTQYLSHLSDNPQLSRGVRSLCGSIKSRLTAHPD